MKYIESLREGEKVNENGYDYLFCGGSPEYQQTGGQSG